MSLRKSTCLTPQRLDAARQNAQRSTGPRSEAGKCHCRMNALKHGERSDPANHCDVMRALGEDPAEFEALKQELRDSFGWDDALSEKQVDDLAYLYVRRDRVERAQTGLMRRARLELEDQQHRRRKEIEGCTMEVGEALNVTLEAPTDPAARLRLLLSSLALIRLQVHKRYFLAWQAAALESFYKKKSGWRGARLCRLLALFAGSDIPLPKGGVGAPLVGAQADEPGGHKGRPYDESDGENDGGAPLVGVQADEQAGHEGRPYDATETADELRYNEMVLLLADEMASVEAEFEYEEQLNEEKVAIERDACLAPSGDEWRMLLRREDSLDRAIDRKIKLLVTLRKAATQKPQTLESRSAPAEDVGTPADDVGAPLVGAQTDSEVGREVPSGDGRHTPAVSSAGA